MAKSKLKLQKQKGRVKRKQRKCTLITNYKMIFVKSRKKSVRRGRSKKSIIKSNNKSKRKISSTSYDRVATEANVVQETAFKQAPSKENDTTGQTEANQVTPSVDVVLKKSQQNQTKQSKIPEVDSMSTLPTEQIGQESELPPSVLQYLEKEDFRLVKFIASSTTCAVYQVLNNTGQELAAKVINHEKLQPQIREVHLANELEIIRLVRHSNIVYTDRILSQLPGFSIIICELASGGDLSVLLEQSDYLPSLEETKTWFRQITNAVFYLHGEGIAHRDIKADNILLCSGRIAKLADFGFATFCRDSQGGTILCDTFCGTTEYQAPETLLCEQSYDGIASDCFSLGIVLYVMLTGQFPFCHGQELQTPEAIRSLHDKIKLKQWPKTELIEQDNQLMSLLAQLLNPAVDERIQAGQILAHRWMAE